MLKRFGLKTGRISSDSRLPIEIAEVSVGASGELLMKLYSRGLDRVKCVTGELEFEVYTRIVAWQLGVKDAPKQSAIDSRSARAGRER
jgi:hypothetical protein